MYVRQGLTLLCSLGWPGTHSLLPQILSAESLLPGEVILAALTVAPCPAFSGLGIRPGLCAFEARTLPTEPHVQHAQLANAWPPFAIRNLSIQKHGLWQSRK